MEKVIMLLKSRIVHILALLIAILIIGTTLMIKMYVPFGISGGVPVVINIEKGASLLRISQQLAESKIIDSPFLFRILITLRSSENTIASGPYLFDSKPFSLHDVARRLSEGERGFKSIKITIPEGSNVFAIAKRIHQGIATIDEADFVEKAKQYEGYLFPETYFFMPYETADDVIKKMRSMFDEQVMQDKALQAAIEKSGRTLSEIIIMASILEGEVPTTVDRKLVADLLWRRIKIGMPLQVDTTFSYINQKTSAQLTLDDLKMDHEYNTYKNKGLPPGPISNPGIDAIRSAAEPTPNKYVFFLSGDDGVSHFSRTYAEHLQLKRMYIQ